MNGFIVTGIQLTGANVSLHIQLKPTNTSLNYLVLVKFGDNPTLNNQYYDSLSLFCSNDMIVEANNTSFYLTFLNMSKVNGYKGYLKDYQWEYKLVEGKEVNAWCMPGGKIVVYSGILPITKDDAGLATVMGHEVAHALANHGQQRMSAGMLQQLGAVGVAAATGGKSAETQQIAMTAYGATTQFGGMLPFSRSHESEADKIGLTLMAIAGYNPEQSVVFWSRMATASGGNKPPEFMSTHPSDETRIANLRRLVPEAKAEALKFGVTFK